MSNTVQSPAAAQPILGPDAPQVVLTASVNGRSTEFSLAAQAVVVIGSRRDCQVPLEHPDVSKVHSAIINTGRDVILCDLQSRTGTFVKDDAIKVRVLSDNDMIRLGSIPIKVQITRPAGCTPSDDPLKPRFPLALNGTGRRFELQGAVSIIGRRSTCDICVDDPDVSLAHALIFQVHDHPAVFDLGSRGGTYLDGRPVTLALLTHGACLRVGGEALEVAWNGPPPKMIPRPAETPTVASPERDALDLGASLLDSDLEDIEQTIVALHSAIAGSRRKIDEQAEQLKKREEQIETLLADLNQRAGRADELQAELSGREQDFVERQAEFEKRCDEFESQRSSIDARLAEIEKDRAALAQSKQECAARADELNVTRADLDARKAELEQRQSTVSANEQAQSEFSQLLEQEKADLEKLRGRIESDRAEIESGRTALAESHAELDKQRSDFEAKRLEIERLAQSHAQREKAILDREAGLEKRQTEFQAASADLEQRTHLLEARNSELEEQAGLVDRRHREIEERAAEIEARAQEMQREQSERAELHKKLEKAKTALKSATRLFATPANASDVAAPANVPDVLDALAKPSESTPDPSSAPAASKRAAAGASPDTPSQKSTRQAGEPAAPAPAPTTHSKPASKSNHSTAKSVEPTPESGAPDEAPDKTHLNADQAERFKVLRRMSNKTDEQLIQQILAETRNKPTGATVSPPKKAKRGWWS